MLNRSYIFSIILALFTLNGGFAQHHDEHAEDEKHETDGHGHADEHHSGGLCGHHDEKFDPAETAFHHIGDANAFHLWGDLYIPLPCMLYAPDKGFNFMLSNAFDYEGNHGNGRKAIDRYVLSHGEVMRIHDTNFPMGEVGIDCITHLEVEKDGKMEELPHAVYNDKAYILEYKSSIDGGVFGGGITSFYDFSITKNVFTMILSFILLFWIFTSAARAYKKRDGQAPKGIQSLVEPIVVFIRDEVAIPFIGDKYERFLPFLLSIFFFILGLNLIGQLPIFPGSANVTGSLAVTGALALITFLITNLNGKGHYWQHIFWNPEAPAYMRPLVGIIEIASLFIKPLTLMLRLAANITAGHIVIVIFVSLIFIFGNATNEVAGSIGGSSMGLALSLPLTLFMMAIEIIVAFIQAFVFCILSASYIGAAVEEGHHHAEEHH